MYKLKTSGDIANKVLSGMTNDVLEEFSFTKVNLTIGNDFCANSCNHMVFGDLTNVKVIGTNFGKNGLSDMVGMDLKSIQSIASMCNGDFNCENLKNIYVNTIESGATSPSTYLINGVDIMFNMTFFPITFIDFTKTKILNCVSKSSCTVDAASATISAVVPPTLTSWNGAWFNSLS